MDSQLKPCPHCCSSDLQVDWNSVYECHFVRCYNCHMQGPEIYGRENAAEAWNNLPRILEWKSEDPTEPGWYIMRKTEPYPDKPNPELCFHYHHTSKGFKHCIAFFNDAKIDSEQGAICKDHNGKFMFAGPIPAPKEEG